VLPITGSELGQPNQNKLNNNNDFSAAVTTTIRNNGSASSHPVDTYELIPDVSSSVAYKRSKNRTNNDIKYFHCAIKGHTKDKCFKLHGTPDCYKELKKKKISNDEPRETLVTTDSDNNNQEEGNISTLINLHKDKSWIINSGTTNHMAFSKNDMLNFNKPRKTKILNTNGVSYPVTDACDVHLSRSLKLINTLVVLSLSTKLISVGQLTEELNCVVLMYPNCCIFQDIQTKEIIGCGVKRGRLYHLENLKIRLANLVESE
jgi:hypothetical protein